MPVIRDQTRHPIPEELIEHWQRRTELDSLISQLESVYDTLELAVQRKDPLYWELHHTYRDITGWLKGIIVTLDQAKPYAVCGVCQGRKQIKCRLCHGYGLISRNRWRTVPEELRGMRQKVDESKCV